MILSLIQESKHFKMGHMHGIEDLDVCHRLRIRGNPRPPRVVKSVKWAPPPPGCYKLNVDGSVHDGRIFAGCIVRNSLGYFVAAFTITLGRGVTLDAEVLAGMHGVVFVRLMGWTNLWVETDSTLAIKILKSNGKTIP